MKLIELLMPKTNVFSCELITEQWETNYSFEWDEESKITEEGINHFNKILQSECALINGNIVLLNESITYEELEEFTGSVAGYCTISNGNKWFDFGVV